MPLSVAELAELATLAHDLRFILAERDVPDELQLLIVRAGYRTLGLFQALRGVGMAGAAGGGAGLRR